MSDWAPTLATGAIMAALGFIVGLAYFALLRRSVSFFVAGGTQLHALALLITRLAIAVAFFLWTVRFGAAAVVFALTGFLLARTVLLRGSE